MQDQEKSDYIKSITPQVQGLLLEGTAPSEICEQFNISPSTVTRIKQKIDPALLATINREREQVLQDKVVDHLEAAMDATINIARQTSNEEWMNTQDAKSLGTMYGIMSDKSIRLLEAMEYARAAREAAKQNEWADELEPEELKR